MAPSSIEGELRERVSEKHSSDLSELEIVTVTKSDVEKIPASLNPYT